MSSRHLQVTLRVRQSPRRWRKEGTRSRARATLRRHPFEGEAFRSGVLGVKMLNRSLQYVRSLQDGLLQRFGSGVERRGTLGRPDAGAQPARGGLVLVQLLVAMGIATLGLVVGSTAVIIGAMLVAPRAATDGPCRVPK
jgi:hypothetical protein